MINRLPYLNGFRFSKTHLLYRAARMGTPVILAAMLSGCLEDDHGHDHDHGVSASDPIEFGDEYWATLAQQYPAAPPNIGAAVEPTQRIVQGDWDTLVDWPIIATGAANLPDGRIMAWSSWQVDDFGNNDAITTPRESTYGTIYSHLDNSFSEQHNSTHDMFCSGVSMLEDGSVFIAGGGKRVSTTSIFSNGEFSEIESLNQTRWYPTSTTLASGQVLASLGNVQSPYPELWTEGEGWDVLENISMQNILDETQVEFRDWYPALNVAPDGSLFHPGHMAELFSIDIHEEHDHSVHSHGDRDEEGESNLYNTTVMYDVGKMLVAGGGYGTRTQLSTGEWEVNSSTTNAAYTMDLNGVEPIIEDTSPLGSKRAMQNSVVLPNGKVIVIGGTTEGVQFSDENSVYSPEIWDPDTGQWTVAAPHTKPRNYHSIAILLKDGRVLSAGGGLCGSCLTNHPDGQVYSPPYLFDAAGELIARPSIVGGESVAIPGQSISIQGSDDIVEFNLVRLVAITHHHTTDQRLIPTSFERTAAGEYRLDLHSNANVLLPGYYWVFGLDANGVPSEGHTVQIQIAPENVPPAAALPLPNVAYEYYEYQSPKPLRLPNFDQLTPDKTGYVEDFNLSEKQRNDHYAFRFRSTLLVPVTGTYTFSIASDDGSRILLDGEMIVDHDGPHGFEAAERTATLELTEGEHAIEVQYFEATGGDALEVTWEGPQFAKQPILGEYLTSDASSQAPSAPAEFTDGAVHYSYYEGTWDSLPSFSGLTPVKSGLTSGFNTNVRNRNNRYAFLYNATIDVEQGGLYTFYTTSDDGSALSVNGIMIVNNDGLHPAQTREGTIMLQAGQHDITVEFFEKTGGDSLVVEWKGPSIDRQQINQGLLSVSDELIQSANDNSNNNGSTGSGSGNDTGDVTQEDGVSFAYYEGVFSALPDFETLTPVKRGISSGFVLNERHQDNFFAFTFDGQITIPTSGTYTFYTRSDDGSRLVINGVEVVSNDGAHATREREGSVFLEAGEHDIDVEYFERGGAQVLNVFWSGPGISKQSIPVSLLSPSVSEADSGSGSDGGSGTSGGNPSAGTDVIAYRYYEGSWRNIPEFDSLVPVSNGQSSTFSLLPRQQDNNYGFEFITRLTVPESGQYTFHTSSDDGSSLSIDGTSIVDNDGLHANRERSGSVVLEQGTYTVSVKFFERAGLDSLAVTWSGPGFAREQLHNAQLSLPELDSGSTGSGSGTTTSPVNDSLMAEYFPGIWTSLPDFDSLTPTRTVSVDNFELPASGGVKFYGYRFTGQIDIVSGGSHTFYVASNDGTQLYIDGQLVVDNDGRHGVIERQGTINLTEGKHDIELRYFQSGGTEALSVSWESTNFSKRPINDGSLSGP